MDGREWEVFAGIVASEGLWLWSGDICEMLELTADLGAVSYSRR